MAVANVRLRSWNYLPSAYSLARPHSPTPFPKPTLFPANSSSPPRFPSPSSGAEAKKFLPTCHVDRWEGHSDPTDARLHFGIWSLGGDWGSCRPRADIVGQVRNNLLRQGETKIHSLVAAAECILNSARIPPLSLLSASPTFEVFLKPLNDALGLPFSKERPSHHRRWLEFIYWFPRLWEMGRTTLNSHMLIWRSMVNTTSMIA